MFSYQPEPDGTPVASAATVCDGVPRSEVGALLGDPSDLYDKGLPVGGIDVVPCTLVNPDDGRWRLRIAVVGGLVADVRPEFEQAKRRPGALTGPDGAVAYPDNEGARGMAPLPRRDSYLQVLSRLDDNPTPTQVRAALTIAHRVATTPALLNGTRSTPATTTTRTRTGSR
ncbi:MAG: hypothetical protein ACRC35_04270 [Angustibacter sp.]